MSRTTETKGLGRQQNKKKNEIKVKELGDRQKGRCCKRKKEGERDCDPISIKRQHRNTQALTGRGWGGGGEREKRQKLSECRGR